MEARRVSPEAVAQAEAPPPTTTSVEASKYKARVSSKCRQCLSNPPILHIFLNFQLLGLSMLTEYLIANPPTKKDSNRYPGYAKVSARLNVCDQFHGDKAFSAQFAWTKVKFDARHHDGARYGLYWLQTQLKHFQALGVGDAECRRSLDFIMDLLPTQWKKHQTILEVVEDYHTNTSKIKRSKGKQYYEAHIQELLSIKVSNPTFANESREMFTVCRGSKTAEYQRLQIMVRKDAEELYKDYVLGMRHVDRGLSTGGDERRIGAKREVPTNPNLNIHDKVDHNNVYTKIEDLLFRATL